MKLRNNGEAIARMLQNNTIPRLALHRKFIEWNLTKKPHKKKGFRVTQNDRIPRKTPPQPR